MIAAIIEKSRKLVLAVALPVCLGLSSSAAALGETAAPVITKLLTVSASARTKTPSFVATGADGTVYIADGSRNNLHLYSAGGAFRKTIALEARPVSLSISPANTVYVGQTTGAEGFIDIYTSEGILTERVPGFIRPASIAFARDGTLYVIDAEALRVVDAGHTVRQTVSGGFISPRSVAVNEQAGELYVLDMGFMANVDGRQTNVWRVQTFSLSDIPSGVTGIFSKYGMSADGSLGFVSSMTIDSMGRLYLTDNLQNIIGIYDPRGIYLGTVFDATATLNPLYASINRATNRLSVISGSGKTFSVFGIDAYANISVEPASLTIQYQAGAGALQAPLILSNIGSATTGWQASFNMPWLTMLPASGEIDRDAQQTVAVRVIPAETAGLTAGRAYSGSITISYNGGTVIVPVTLVMNDSPVMTLTPEIINITKRISEAGAISDIAITISNDLSGVKTWTAQSDVPWLAIAQKAAGGAPVNGPATTTSVAQIVLSGDPAAPINTTAGTYTGHIIFSSEGVRGSPALLRVNVTVVAAGKILVTTDNADAKFSIAGPDRVYEGQGTQYTTTAAAGDYRITFSPVKGYKTPAPQTKTLSADNETITFHGRYRDLRKKMNIIASHGAGPSEPSEIAVFDSAGQLQLKFSPFPPRQMYGANTAVGDFDGDGIMDIMAGSGGGTNLQAVVKGFKRGGSPLSGLAFKAYKERTGVIVAAGDFDGDAKDEIVTGRTNGSTVVRIFSYAPSGETVRDTGASFEAYPGQSGGVTLAVADVNADGLPEIITLQRSGPANRQLKVFRINTAEGAGKWTAVTEPVAEFGVCPADAASEGTSAADTAINLAAADVTGDGIAEILAACPGAGVRIYSGNGELIEAIPAGPAGSDFIAAGDLTLDGIAEIVLGDARENSVRIPGQPDRGFRAFKRSLGVKVSVGDLGYGN
ncbi:MAG: hypothetical protein EPN25_05640 [Nitrospirae bacterium]|nr:MAG: hypothetical protein EPN25_05640 [Nitrospirota bacterium]